MQAEHTERQEQEQHLRALLVCDLNSGFERLVSAYQHRLYAFALRLCGHPMDADEIAQEAFVRAYRALQSYPAVRVQALALRPWLYQITLNIFRNRIRGRSLPIVSLDLPASTESAPLEIAGNASEWPEAAVEAAEQRSELAKRVAALPEHLRIALVLRHIEGMSYREMADLLGQPAGTIKAHVHRGARLLRAALIADGITG